MRILPDPRFYPPFSSNSLVMLAEQMAGRGSALQQGHAASALVDALRAALERRDDAVIEEALAKPTSTVTQAILLRSLETALEPGAEAALAMRVFAIPLLIVTGGRASVVVPGVVPDVGELQKLFAVHGALGQARNFALGNALASAEGLAAVKPSMLYRFSHGLDGQSFRQADLVPADITADSSDERVHLRFLAGAALTAAQAPGFTETAGNIGAWGMPFTQALAAQLGREGLSLLPIPRPPMNFLRALEAGTFALREIGFQLFLSNALRKFRARVGEPQVSVAACSDATVRIRLGSPFDESLADEYRWPLYPGDDLSTVSQSIFGLLTECRLENIQVAETVEPVGASQ